MPLDFTMPTQFRGILSTITPLDVLDILIVAVILYRVYVMLKDTRAITLGKGILVLLGVTVVANYLNLHVISWLLQKAVTLLFVAPDCFSAGAAPRTVASRTGQVFPPRHASRR